MSDDAKKMALGTGLGIALLAGAVEYRNIQDANIGTPETVVLDGARAHIKIPDNGRLITLDGTDFNKQNPDSTVSHTTWSKATFDLNDRGYSKLVVHDRVLQSLDKKEIATNEPGAQVVAAKGSLYVDENKYIGRFTGGSTFYGAGCELHRTTTDIDTGKPIAFVESFSNTFIYFGPDNTLIPASTEHAIAGSNALILYKGARVTLTDFSPELVGDDNPPRGSSYYEITVKTPLHQTGYQGIMYPIAGERNKLLVMTSPHSAEPPIMLRIEPAAQCSPAWETLWAKIPATYCPTPFTPVKLQRSSGSIEVKDGAMLTPEGAQAMIKNGIATPPQDAIAPQSYVDRLAAKTSVKLGIGG